ncbi:MAG: nucleotide exchange factor GrpE [Alphaproteobacteria bacterium]|nr:nucleotide exchange factor GrpE [Alphaproteobacteria bacterium]
MTDENKELNECNVAATECADDNADLQVMIAELSDKYLRARAEMENVKRRAAIDIESRARIRAMSVAENFIPLIDAIDAAIAHNSGDDGLRTLAAAAENALARVGITRIETIGQKLNPAFHNAINTEESDAPADTIIKEFQGGFMFGDSVLRTAMVITAK